MRKVLSLFCAALVALSASAFPQVKSIANAKSIAELEATLPATKAQFGHTERLVAAPANAVKKAPAAVVDGKIVADYAQAMYYSESYTGSTAYWSFQFFNGDSFAAAAMVDAIAEDAIAGTYTIGKGYGEVIVAAGDTATITSGTLTITYAAPNYHFALNATCDNGNTYTMELDYAAEEFTAVNYMLYYYYQMGYISFDYCLIELDDAPFSPTGKTIDIVCPGVSILTDLTGSAGAFQLYNESDEYLASLTAYAKQVVGNYGKADIYYDYTYLALYTDTVEAGYVEVAFKKYAGDTVTVKVVGDTTMVDASLMGKDGNIYHIVMKHYIPTPTSFVDVNIENGKAYSDPEEGTVTFAGSNSDYVLALYLYNDGAGTYTTDDVIYLNDEDGSYLLNTTTDVMPLIVSASITVADDYSFTAQFISTDAVQYNITFKAVETALDNTATEAAPAQKLIRNGQLVIIKDNVEYNALGVQL